MNLNISTDDINTSEDIDSNTRDRFCQIFFFFFFLFNFVTSPEGPLHNTIIFTTVLEMLFTISTVTRETNAILHKIRLGFEQLAPALHT